MKRIGITLASLMVVACTGTVDSTDPGGNVPPPGSTSGSDGNTFDHDNDQISPWDLLARIQLEGPPEYTAHVHGCPKIRVANLGNLLTTIGVKMPNTVQLSAGELYADGTDALGGPNYVNRIRENIQIQTSGASKEFDIFAAAAPEVIAAMPTNAACMVGGTPAALFDSTGTMCQVSGVSCLIGYPATAEHIALCNETIAKASTPTIGKQMAVAVLLAAGNTCE